MSSHLAGAAAGWGGGVAQESTGTTVSVHPLHKPITGLGEGTTKAGCSPVGPAGNPSSPGASHTTHRQAEGKGVAGTEVDEVGKVRPTGACREGPGPWPYPGPTGPLELLSSGLCPLAGGRLGEDIEPG